MKSLAAWLWCGVVLLGGCAPWDLLGVSSTLPEELQPEQSEATLVGDLAVPFGMFPVKVEAVGLVAGLRGTGSDPHPSPQRAALLGEMQTRGVPHPNRVLQSTDTALVLVRGVLRPGIQKGDRFDLEVRIPSRSETTSLRGGHLLETRLHELAVLNNQIREGTLLALAQGPVMVDPAADAKRDRVLQCRGRVLGGGVALKSRPLGLVLKSAHQDVRTSSRVENALNKRFHTVRKGIKLGVAKAKTDKYIELTVHPRYKDNIPRYVRVVRAVAMRESASERMQRVVRLTHRLLDPATAAEAAVQLEAIGSQGAEALLKGIASDNAEVRFCSAEALAYLDRREAAKPLGEAALRQPAFRVFALTALSAMDHYAAYEQLQKLLAVSSAETRYGAFRALWAMNPNDPLVLGEKLGGQFSYHVLDTAGPPMIHVTRSRRPEIVLFGQDQRLLAPLSVNAGNQVMVTGTPEGKISVAKFSVEQSDQKRLVSTKVDEVIRAIVELGGTYPDVVQALQEAKAAGALPSRFQVDALPKAGRTYDRVADDPRRQQHGERADDHAGTAIPDLFLHRGGPSATSRQETSSKSDEGRSGRPDPPGSPNPLKGFFARMTGRESN